MPSWSGKHDMDGCTINGEETAWASSSWEFKTGDWLDFLGQYEDLLYWWSLKKEDKFTGQGWLCRSTGSADVMMGAMNLRKSLSPLYAECEALIWAMDCMKTLQFSDVVFATDCFQLVKMVSTPEDWPAFSTHMEEFRRSKCFFPYFRIRRIPRAQNTLADKLARGAMNSPSAMRYVDYIPPVWLAESIRSA